MTVQRFNIIVMLFLLVVCPVLLAAGTQTLTIDSQLGTSIEDCFDRITIGEQLSPSAIYRNVSELTIRECEQICKQDIQCQVYDYGVGAKGNASCNLSKFTNAELKDQLFRNPDYDLYIRRVLCEQGPPIPLIPLSDETNPSSPGPVHRPVFRPVDDEPRRPADQHPLAGEYSRPQGVRPYVSNIRPVRPPYGVSYSRPFDHKPVNNHIDDRPDDNVNQRPDNDHITGYGQHRPQDIPFRPEIPLRPSSQNLSRPKPDPYDELNFQDPYYRPPMYGPGYWRPDPYFPPSPDDEIQDIYGPKPIRPSHHYRPVQPLYEIPNHHYNVRPNRRPTYQNPPRPHEYFGYMPLKPYEDYQRPDNGYDQNNQSPMDNPMRPSRPPHRPTSDYDQYPPRPIEKPSHNSGSQYASGYGQNSHYDQENSIHVEIHDPPRPYKPPKRPVSDRPISSGYDQNDDDGYGSQSSSGYNQGDYSSQSSQSNYLKPQSSINYPISGYGQTDHNYNSGSSQNAYVRPSYTPVDVRPSKLSYGNQDTPSYSSQSSYSSSQYGQCDSHDYNYASQKPSKPYKPPQSDNHLGYGSDSHYANDNQGSHGSISHGSYGSSIPGSYGSNSQSTYGSSNQGSFGVSSGGHGSQSTFDSNPSSYGSTQQSSGYGTSPSSSSQYGTQSHSDSNYDRPDQPYGNEPSDNEDQGYKNNKRPTTPKPIRKPKPTDRPSTQIEDDKNKPSYGNQGEDNDKKRPVNHIPDKPAYGNRPDVRPVYEYDLDRPNGAPVFIIRPDGQVVTSRPVSISDYGNRRPAYGVGRNPGHRVSYEACFRRVLAGKRAVRSHVRRVLPCERLEDCRRECATERRFHCESFNYKLDPSFRGKGLCELMTKPIEEFNLKRDFVEDKDFDFFEVDRNSLEPDCLETLRGPGMLHSGFLSSQPDGITAGDRKWDRHDDRYGDRRGYHHAGRHGYGERRGSHYGSRTYEHYIPYQIGLARSNEADDTWGQYGGSYGGSNTYYKDRKDYRNSVNHWRLSPPQYEDFTSPSQDFDYNNLGRSHSDVDYGHGSWRGSHWNRTEESPGPTGLWYGETNYYRPKPKIHYLPQERTDEGVTSDCSSRRRQGMSLGSGAIRRSSRARNVVACEAACFNEVEFKCVSYSYRYSTAQGIDNCFLSERQYKGLDLASDSGSDVYAMPQDRGCSAIQTPWVESECFWHVRSDAAISSIAVKAALTVAGLGACEAECIRATGFFCRGFSFRYDAPRIGEDLDNCLLTSHPPTSLDLDNGLTKISGYEMYARGNYGRGCEPALYDETHHKKQCYVKYDGEAKLLDEAVRGQLHVQTMNECAEACTKAPFRCLSYSIDAKTHGSINCLLSDVRIFDLKNRVDYVNSKDHWLYSLDLFNRDCWPNIHGNSRHNDPTHETSKHELSRFLDEQSKPFRSPDDDLIERRTRPPQNEILEEYKAHPLFLPGNILYPKYYKDKYPSLSGIDDVKTPKYEPTYPEYGPPSDEFEPIKEQEYITKPLQYLPDLDSGTVFRPTSSDPYTTSYGPPVAQNVPDSDPYAPSYGPLVGQNVPDFHQGPGFRRDHTRPSYDPEPPTAQNLPNYNDGPVFRPHYTAPGFRPRLDNRGYLPSPDVGPDFRHPRPSGPAAEPGDRDGGIIISWNRYTVSGYPCIYNTTCAQNKIAGHWACEPEGGEIGSWDYCCAPNQRCGYSEGFYKPWCYVGHDKEQWRPCSETYYPYHEHHVPHPSLAPNQGPHSSRVSDRLLHPSDFLHRKRPSPPEKYMPMEDMAYWDNIQTVGADGYYDKYGDFIGYTRVPLKNHPHIRYSHNNPPSGDGRWEPVAADRDRSELERNSILGLPRYWPVAYLHRGPPPNITYFKFDKNNATAFKNKYRFNQTTNLPPTVQLLPNISLAVDKNRDGNKVEARKEKNRNITNEKVINNTIATAKISTTNTSNSNSTIGRKEMKESMLKSNTSQVDVSTVKADVKDDENDEDEEDEDDEVKGIDDKLDDFKDSVVIVDHNTKTDSKPSDTRTLEAEEDQIAAIGRYIAFQRGEKSSLEKRSQKELEAKSITLNDNFEEFNFGNRFPTSERKGRVQKVSKDEIERDRLNDKSLEVSETTFVRPPRILSTTDNIRKTMVNGKIFYDATLREQRDLFHTNHTRKSNRNKGVRSLDDMKAPSVLTNQTFGKKKTIIARNTNPVRRVRRIYRKRYNPDEVRRRLLERDRITKQDATSNSKQKI